MAQLDLTELAPRRESIKIEVQRKGWFRRYKEEKEITYNNCDLQTIAMFMKQMGDFDRLQKNELSEAEFAEIVYRSAVLLWETFAQDPKNSWLRIEDITELSVDQVIAILHHVLKTITEEVEESAEDVKKK